MLVIFYAKLDELISNEYRQIFQVHLSRQRLYLFICCLHKFPDNQQTANAACLQDIILTNYLDWGHECV